MSYSREKSYIDKMSLKPPSLKYHARRSMIKNNVNYDDDKFHRETLGLQYPYNLDLNDVSEMEKESAILNGYLDLASAMMSKEEGLILSIKMKDINAIEFFEDIGARNYKGALIETVRRSNVELYRYFIRKIPREDLTDEFISIILQNACLLDSKTMLDEINFEIHDSVLKDALNFAAKYSDIVIIDALMQKGAEVTNDTLLGCAETNRWDNFTHLVDGWDFELPSDILSHAVYHNSYDFVWMILQQGFTETALNKALVTAAYKSDHNMMELLISHGAIVTSKAIKMCIIDKGGTLMNFSYLIQKYPKRINKKKLLRIIADYKRTSFMKYLLTYEYGTYTEHDVHRAMVSAILDNRDFDVLMTFSSTLSDDDDEAEWHLPWMMGQVALMNMEKQDIQAFFILVRAKKYIEKILGPVDYEDMDIVAQTIYDKDKLELGFVYVGLLEYLGKLIDFSDVIPEDVASRYTSNSRILHDKLDRDD